MRRIRETYEVISIKGIRTWRENGRRRQETKTFEQTVNPFNKNAEGKVKSREEIYRELEAERRLWLDEVTTKRVLWNH